MKNLPMILIQFLAPLLLVLSVSAQGQTSTMIDEMIAAQRVYEAKREVVLRENAAAIAGLNIAVDPAAIAALRTDIDALKAQAAADAARRVAQMAAAKAALDAVSKATTIAGLRAALVVYLQTMAQ